ncbi:MAG: hypothetical protein R3F65_11385 [bacterium]|nr:hypothetical protein [Myxococcales bacterium]MCB9542162.1 hypothetical protein [Myxococcales bacterium]
MKTVIRSLLALAMLGAPLAASAQEAGGEDVKTKFYDFDDMLIDGQYKKPQVLYTDARQKVNFERLLKLKKEFLPKLKATAKDASLR